TAMVTVWVHRSGRQERRHGCIVPRTSFTCICGILLFLLSLFILAPLCSCFDPFCHALKRLPEHGTSLKCATGIFARQGNEGVRASPSSRFRICQPENICN